MSENERSTLLKILTGGSILLLGLGFELGASFGAKVLIARFLGPVSYGGVMLGMTIVSLTSSLVLLGLNQGIGRYLPRFDDDTERRGVLVSGYRLGVTSGLVAGATMYFTAAILATAVFDDPSLEPLFRIFAFAIPCWIVVRLTLGTVQGMEQSLPRVYIENITLPLVRFAGFAVVVAFGYGALGAAGAYLASFAAGSLLSVWYLVRHTPLFSFGAGYVSKESTLLRFSLPIALSSVVTFVYHDVDTVLLGYYMSASEVGIYNVVYPIAQLLLIGLQAVGFIFMPILSRLHSTGAYDDMGRLYRTITKWIFSGTLPVFLVVALFPEMTLKVTFGSEYLPGAASLSVLAIGFLVHATAGPTSNILTSIGKTRWILYDSIATATLNLLLNILLIPQYSYFGAAVATTCSYLLLNGLYSLQVYRATGIHPLTSEFVVPSLIGSGLLAGIYFLTTIVVNVTVPALVVLFVVFVTLYGVVVLRFGIQENEISLILELEDTHDIDLGPIKRIANAVMKT